jgi:transposase InsO family protein
VNFIDDHSRLAVASRVLARATAPAVLRIFQEAGATWGFPAALLTDNGCVYTTWHRGGPNVMQTELLAMGIDYRRSRPYHPQTCGKVERFHQTLKAFLAKQDPARSMTMLQTQVDRFVDYYNDVRPHRACDRRARHGPRSMLETRLDPRGRRSWRVRACASVVIGRQAGQAHAPPPHEAASHRDGGGAPGQAGCDADR